MWWGSPHPRAALPQRLSSTEPFQQGSRGRTSVPASGPAPCCGPCSCHGSTICKTTGVCKGLTRLKLIAPGLSDRRLQQPTLWLNCSIIWAYLLHPLPESAVPLLSHMCFLKSLLGPFMQEEWIWIQLCLWYLLFHLLVLPKLGYKIRSFPFAGDCL